MTENVTTGNDAQSETNQPKTFHDYDGESVGLTDLEEGDNVALRVSWYGSFEETKERPTEFTVTEPVSDAARRVAENGNTPMDSVKFEGDDGHTYKVYTDNPHVECTTDDKDGYDRGTLSARPKRLG